MAHHTRTLLSATDARTCKSEMSAGYKGVIATIERADTWAASASEGCRCTAAAADRHDPWPHPQKCTVFGL